VLGNPTARRPCHVLMVLSLLLQSKSSNRKLDRASTSLSFFGVRLAALLLNVYALHLQERTCDRATNVTAGR